MGRKTSEEEARDYLQSIGLDISELEKAKASAGVPEPEQMVEEFGAALYSQMRSGSLTGIALVNGLKAVAILAESARKNEIEERGPERGIDEILADAGLPTERKQEIADTELLRLSSRLEALRRVRDGLTEPAAV